MRPARGERCRPMAICRAAIWIEAVVLHWELAIPGFWRLRNRRFPNPHTCFGCKGSAIHFLEKEESANADRVMFSGFFNEIFFVQVIFLHQLMQLPGGDAGNLGRAVDPALVGS